HLLGPIRQVTGVLGNAVFERQVEDTAAALFQFADGPFAALAVTHAAAEPQDTLDVFGTRGSIRASPLNSGVISIRTGDEHRRESHPSAANVHLPLIEDFVDAIATDREPVVNGAIGRAVAEVEDLIYAQATT